MTITAVAGESEHPVFRMYSDAELAVKTGYSADYIRRLRIGERELTIRTRQIIAARLRRKESTLFIE